jgi:hypothetical protein
MEKGLSSEAKELLEKFRITGKKGITSPEMRKMGKLGHAPLDELTDKDIIRGGWETREIDGVKVNVYVFRIRER